MSENPDIMGEISKSPPKFWNWQRNPEIQNRSINFEIITKITKSSPKSPKFRNHHQNSVITTKIPKSATKSQNRHQDLKILKWSYACRNYHCNPEIKAKISISSEIPKLPPKYWNIHQNPEIIAEIIAKISKPSPKPWNYNWNSEIVTKIPKSLLKSHNHHRNHGRNSEIIIEIPKSSSKSGNHGRNHRNSKIATKIPKSSLKSSQKSHKIMTKIPQLSQNFLLIKGSLIVKLSTSVGHDCRRTYIRTHR